jgi:hypothetical protein
MPCPVGLPASNFIFCFGTGMRLAVLSRLIARGGNHRPVHLATGGFVDYCFTVPAIREGIGAVGTRFDQHSLGRQIVAIAAAYIIAVSTVIASFAAARVAAEGIGDPLGAICHTSIPGAPQPADNEGSAQHCIDNCSAGCLILAALPPPPEAVRVALSPIPAPTPFAALVLVSRLDSKSHRSRAPPRAR